MLVFSVSMISAGVPFSIASRSCRCCASERLPLPGSAKK
jgi:hypothetical protein